MVAKCGTLFLIPVCDDVRSCMVEESGTLESQLEATKVKCTLCTHAKAVRKQATHRILG